MNTQTIPPRLRAIFAAAAAAPFLVLGALAQQPADPVDQPVDPASLAPGQLDRYRAPLMAEISPVALGDARGRISGCSGFNRNSWNLINERCGFEPASYRTLVRPVKDDPGIVWLAEGPGAERREGFYDGARVRVYHPIGGKMALVRDARVAQGGHWASGWKALHDALSAKEDVTEFKFVFGDNWNHHWRMDVPYYFAVRAVDVEGTASELSNAAAVTPAESADKQTKSDPGLPFQFRKTGEALDAPPPPANLSATLEGGVVTLRWEKPAGTNLAGYRVYFSTQDPARHKGYALKLDGRGPLPNEIIQAGDLVFIDCEKTRFDKEMFCPWDRWSYHHTYGWATAGLEGFPWWPDTDPKREWELVKHPAPLPPEFVTGGETCLKIRNDTDAPAYVNLNILGGSKQDWYWVLPAKKHAVEAWVRCEGGGELQIQFYGKNKPPELGSEEFPFLGRKSNAPNPDAIPPVTLPLASGWTKVRGEFTPPTVIEEGLAHLMLAYHGPGTLYLDDLRVYEADAPPADLPPLTIQRLRESNMKYQRTHELIKTKNGYSLAGMTNPVGSNNVPGGTDYRLATFFGLLDAMRRAGAYSPWLQVEMCLAEEEWRGFAEWMAAPYDPDQGDTPEKKPWAYKRWSMGQKKPWLDEFERFAFEIGNETWNGLFYPWVFNGYVRDSKTGRRHDYGEVYGMYFEYVIGQLRASDYWTPEIEKRTDYILDGWNGNNRHAASGVRYCPSATRLTYAAYNSNTGLGDPKVPSDFKRFMMMQWSVMGVQKQLASERRSLEALRAEGFRNVELGMYEYGPGYHVMPGEGAQQQVDNNIARGMIGAVFTLDATLLKAREGHADQAFFTIGHDRGAWGSWALLRDGGHAYPFWKAIEIFNRAGTGAFLDCATPSMPRWDFPAYETQDNMNRVKREAVPEAPMASLYATRDGDRLALFLISRKLDNFPIAGDDGFTPVTVRLPFDRAKKATLYRLAGDPRTDDRFAENIKVAPVEIPASSVRREFVVNAATGGDARGLPPASIFIYVFEGANLPKANTRPRPLALLPKTIIAGEPAKLGNGTVDADGDKPAFAWDLADAGTSAEAEPTVTFPSAGLRRITLAADDGRGGKASESFDVHVEAPVSEGLALGVGYGSWGWSVPDPERCAKATMENGTLMVRRAEGDRDQPMIVTREPVTGDLAIEAEVLSANGKAGVVLCTQAPYFFYWAPGTRFGVLVDPSGAVSLTGHNIDAKPRLPAGSATFPCRLRIVRKGDTATGYVMAGGEWKQVGMIGGIEPEGYVGVTSQSAEAAFKDIRLGKP